jgi:hypothetical protein
LLKIRVFSLFNNLRLWTKAVEKVLATALLADKGLIMEGLMRVLSILVIMSKEEEEKKKKNRFFVGNI